MIDIHEIRVQLRDYLRGRIRQIPAFQARMDCVTHLFQEGCRNSQTWSQIVQSVAKDWESRKPSLLIPTLPDDPGRLYSPALPAGPYRCFATDGSQILPSRHDIPDLALVRLARIAVGYRTGGGASLTATTQLLTPDLLETALAAPLERPPFDKFVVDERDTAELEHLAELSREYPGEEPALALLDGTLIWWTLEDRSAAWKGLQLGRLREAFDRLRESRTPVAGYISRPGSREVVHALAIYHYHQVHGRPPQKPAELLAGEEPGEAGDFGPGITDRQIFDRLLAPGQRSGWFGSGSFVLRDYGPEDRILFCYLKTEAEVVRLEIPAWAEPYSETLHTLALDQCRKGRGYPITLSEAHEQAVIRAQDRELFYRLAGDEWFRLRRETGVKSPLPQASMKQQRKRRPVF